MEIEPIAHIRTDFPEKFGIPRQSGLADALEGRIVFTPKYRQAEALDGLEGFDYIWLIWEFSQVPEGKYSAHPRPPRLGGNASMGVYATRSPFRPNRLGLSSVRIAGIDRDTAEGPVIRVCGADLMDGTPIYDIKPYIPYADAHPDAACGYVGSLEERCLDVEFEDGAFTDEPSPEFMKALTQVLSLDPRPSYHDDPERVYGLSFRDLNVRFRVCGHTLTVISAAKNA